MARTADQITSDLDAVKSSLGRAERRVRFSDGREVEYFGTDDKLKAITALQAELQEAQGGGKSNTSVAQHRRGDGPSGPPRWYW